MDQNTNIESKAGFFSKSYLKHIVAFFGLILLVGGSYFVWDGYLSDSAKNARQMQKQYENYTNWDNNVKKTLSEDTYGGKTAQETLIMFIDALKNGDVELASKYFELETNEKDPYFLTRNRWVESLRKAKEENRLVEIINITEKAKFDEKSSWKETAWFSILNNVGIADYTIILNLNTFSNIWKIESL